MIGVNWKKGGIRRQCRREGMREGFEEPPQGSLQLENLETRMLALPGGARPACRSASGTSSCQCWLEPAQHWHDAQRPACRRACGLRDSD